MLAMKGCRYSCLRLPRLLAVQDFCDLIAASLVMRLRRAHTLAENQLETATAAEELAKPNSFKALLQNEGPTRGSSS